MLNVPDIQNHLLFDHDVSITLNIISLIFESNSFYEICFFLLEA